MSHVGQNEGQYQLTPLANGASRSMGAAPEFLEIHADYCLRLLHRSTVENSLICKVRAALRACLAEGNANLDRVAERIGTSARTLQRRLREMNTSHRILLSELRSQLAVEYATSAYQSRGRVARALGYANARSLKRASRHWVEESSEPALAEPAHDR